MKIIFVLFGALLLWSCDTTRTHGPELPYYSFALGSRLVLHQELTIPANWATVRLQAGKVAAFGHVQEQEPHCIVEADTVLEKPQRILPDTFMIIRVQRSIGEIANAPGFFIRAGFAGDNRPTQMFFKTTFTLRSDKQPGVMRMVCQSDQYAAGSGIPRHLSVSEIRKTLGNILALELP
ncbi:MAG: hypothetical protein HXY27_08520 [Hydrogenophilaceae bacterium]|nr:hypothetical protein [Hydrogenophilaceae bacterium]